MNETLSRRDILRAGGFLLLTAVGMRMGLDTLLAPLELDTRRGIFRRLVGEIDTPEGKKILRSWLLFQGAQAIAAGRGDWITAEAQQRYLFGDGSAWNITPALERHLVSRQGPFRGAVRDGDHALTLFYQNIIQQGIDNAKTIDRSFTSATPISVMKRKIERGKPFDFSFQGIAYGGKVSRDVLSTLANFTVYHTGRIDRVSRVSTPMREGWRLFQRGGSAHLYDFHDWNADPNKLGGRIRAADIMYGVLMPLGVKDPRSLMQQLIGDNGLDTLENSAIEIRGKDAIRLEKHKLAKPYPIYTKPHQLQAVCSWYMPDYFFSNDPIFSP